MSELKTTKLLLLKDVRQQQWLQDRGISFVTLLPQLSVSESQKEYTSCKCTFTTCFNPFTHQMRKKHPVPRHNTVRDSAGYMPGPPCSLTRLPTTLSPESCPSSSHSDSLSHLGPLHILILFLILLLPTKGRIWRLRATSVNVDEAN